MSRRYLCLVCERPASVATRRLAGYLTPICAPCAALLRAVMLPSIHEDTPSEGRR